MATSSEAVRTQLAVVTTAAAAELAAEAASVPPEQRVTSLFAALPLVVPSYYDAAGALATVWYEEIREESRPTTLYTPSIIGDPTTDWIEREVAKLAPEIEADFEAELARLTDEITGLAEKEVARGFRESMLGNARMDDEAIGWSRVARPGACRFCRMLADKGAYFATESSAEFGAHINCHCAVRAQFRNGEHGPEAEVMQYVAANKQRSPAQRAALREYLYENYGGSKPAGYGEKKPSATLGFDSQSDQWVRDQIAITENLKPTEWREKQLARLRARLS